MHGLVPFHEAVRGERPCIAAMGENRLGFSQLPLARDGAAIDRSLIDSPFVRQAKRCTYVIYVYLVDITTPVSS